MMGIDRIFIKRVQASNILPISNHNIMSKRDVWTYDFKSSYEGKILNGKGQESDDCVDTVVRW